MTKKTISLVLGSGGARGLAHIGIIHWLKENEYDIRSISGCSMGALVGGVYACDKLDEFEEWMRAISKLDIVRLLDISWGKQGLVEGERIMTALKDLVAVVLDSRRTQRYESARRRHSEPGADCSDL